MSFEQMAEQKNAEVVKKTITEVSEALVEKGYKPVPQIAGYIVTGDPAYITAYKDARNKIQQLDRFEIMEIILKAYNK